MKYIVINFNPYDELRIMAEENQIEQIEDAIRSFKKTDIYESSHWHEEDFVEYLDDKGIEFLLVDKNTVELNFEDL